MGLTRVFQPIRIRGIDVPNRIVRAAHGTALGSPPTLLGGEDWLAYHVARARGGVGLTILEAATVHPSSGGLGVLDDAAIDARMTAPALTGRSGTPAPVYRCDPSCLRMADVTQPVSPP